MNGTSMSDEVIDRKIAVIFVVFTVRDTYWAETNFDHHIMSLCQSNRVRLHECRTEPYIQEEGSECKLLVLEVL